MSGMLQAKLARLGLVQRSEAAPLSSVAVAGRAELMPGTEWLTDAGPVWVHERRFAPGTGPLPATARKLTSQERSVIFRRPPRSGETVAFDIETTSLSSGAGVHTFLVGLGWWEDDGVVVRQVLMRSPLEEEALLSHVLQVLQRFTGLLSFCGRGFDVPRFRDRLAYAGRSERLPVFPHDDLAPLSRQVFAGRLADGRLGSAERCILGFQRHEDLPGAECPREWFALQRGQAHRMAAVMEHNALDVVSLFGLEWMLLQEIAHPKTAAAAMFSTLACMEAGDLPSAVRSMRFAEALAQGANAAPAPVGITQAFERARRRLTSVR